MIGIGILEDHPIYRSGLCIGLEQEADIQVVWETQSGWEALSLCHSQPVDVVLADLKLPDLPGVEFIRSVAEAGLDCRIIALSGFLEPWMIPELQDLGVRGILSKSEPVPEIAKAVREVVADGIVVSRELLLADEERPTKSHRGHTADLGLYSRAVDAQITPVLLRVLHLVSEGYSDREIAERREKSRHTIRHQVDALKRIAGVQRRSALAAWAAERGMLNWDLDSYERFHDRQAGERAGVIRQGKTPVVNQ